MLNRRITVRESQLGLSGILCPGQQGTSNNASCNLPMEMQFRLFGENFTTITMLDGLTITEVDGLRQSRYKHVFKNKPKFMKYLHTLGKQVQ